MTTRWARLALIVAAFATASFLSACESTGERPSNPDGWSILDGPWDAPWFKDRPN